MDFESSHQVSNYLVRIGWSDADRQFYATIHHIDVALDTEPLESLKNSTDCLRMLDWLSETIEERIGVAEFYPPQHDISKLMDAPRIEAQPLSVEDFLANPGQYMDSSGTVYPQGRPASVAAFLQDRDITNTPHDPSYNAFLAFIENDSSGLEQDDLAEEFQDLLNELTFCVEVLDGIQDVVRSSEPSAFGNTREERDSDALARAAMNLLHISNELIMSFSYGDIDIFAHASELDQLLDFQALFPPEKQAIIDSFVNRICGVPLSEFPSTLASDRSRLVHLDGSVRAAGNGTAREEPLAALEALRACVGSLRELQQREEQGEGSIYGTLDARRSSALAYTAAELLSKIPALTEGLPNDYVERLLMASPHGELWTLEEVIEPDLLDKIDTFVEGICRTKLTGFVSAVAHGFNPTNGVPFDCSYPATYNPEVLYPSPQTEIFLQGCGMPEDQAVELARIQRLDCRDRTEEDWVYLESRRLTFRSEQSSGRGS